MAAYAVVCLENSLKTGFWESVSGINFRRIQDVNTGDSNHFELRRNHEFFTFTADSFV
jgi:hypothetical protein